MRILAAATAFSLMALAPAAGARAEDFSGFYAGLNAGYAFDKDHGRRDTAPGAGPQSGLAEDTSLPPSATSAAKGMQSARTGAAKAR